MAQFQATATDSERRALLNLRYARKEQKERRAWWWYNRLRVLILAGQIEGSRAVECYERLFGNGERVDYLKQYIKDSKAAN